MIITQYIVIIFPPAQILFQHLVVEAVEMLADDQVIFQLNFECFESSLEVRQTSVLGRKSDRLHGLQLWPGVSERKIIDDNFYVELQVLT